MNRLRLSLRTLAACLALGCIPFVSAQKTLSPEGGAVLRELIEANDRQLEESLNGSEPRSGCGFGGRMQAEGDRVYLTGVTPFRHVLTFR